MLADLKETSDYSPAGRAADVAPRKLEVPRELAGMRLDQALAKMFPEHSRSRCATWLRDGTVTLDGRIASPSQKVWGRELLTILSTTAPDQDFAAAQDIPLNILYQDEHVLVIDKPAGLVVHPGNGNPENTLLNALLYHAPQLAGVPRAGIVHRLDKDTSGLLVVAMTLPAQTNLVRQLQARTVKREYFALIHGVLHGEGEIDAPVGRDPQNRIRMAVTGSGKEARTRYRAIEHFDKSTLVTCNLDTGRTHQIRVHMQSIGHPLVGDPVYRAGRPVGSERAGPVDSFKRQALHARNLGFLHPSAGLPVEFESPLPPDFSGLLDALRQAR